MVVAVWCLDRTEEYWGRVHTGYMVPLRPWSSSVVLRFSTNQGVRTARLLRAKNADGALANRKANPPLSRMVKPTYLPPSLPTLPGSTFSSVTATCRLSATQTYSLPISSTASNPLGCGGFLAWCDIASVPNQTSQCRIRSGPECPASSRQAGSTPPAARPCPRRR